MYSIYLIFIFNYRIYIYTYIIHSLAHSLTLVGAREAVWSEPTLKCFLYPLPQHLGGLTYHEFNASRLGLSAAPSAIRTWYSHHPASVHLRKKGVVTSVKDEGACGAYSFCLQFLLHVISRSCWLLLIALNSW